VKLAKRFCSACGREMTHKDIAVDTNWGKYTVMVTGMTAHECRNCSETVVDAEEILVLHELEQRFSEFPKADWKPARRLPDRAAPQADSDHVNQVVVNVVDNDTDNSMVRSTNQLDNGSSQQLKAKSKNLAVDRSTNKPKDKSDLLGVKEVAELLQIAPQNVYSLIYVEKLPAVKIGNAWRFKREDVHAFMAANTM